MEIQLEDALLFPLMALETMKPELFSFPSPHLRQLRLLPSPLRAPLQRPSLSIVVGHRQT